MKDEKTQGSLLLKEAVFDAEKLMAHASEYGIDLEPQYIKYIVAAKKCNLKNEWTEQEEIDFWLAFQVLSKVVYPVTIDSLRATTIPPFEPYSNWWDRFLRKRQRSEVEISVRFYRRFAMIAMAVMLITQIYSLIGTGLMAKWQEGNKRMMEIEKRMRSLMLISSSNEEDKTARMEQQNLEIELDELGQAVESSIKLLDSWLETTYNVWFSSIEETSKAVIASKAVSAPPFEVAKPSVSRNIVVIQRSKSLIVVLNQYILPLFYGLIGGIAFVLRSIAKDTKMMTYAPNSKIKYGLRVHLGGLAGLMIGFLWGDLQGKTFGVVESLSPLAVAFVAGYSVDFIFRMLDSVIGVTSKKTENEQPPMKGV